MENISEHITYAEATDSFTAKKLGIDNTPDEEHLARMRTLAEKIFEPLRQHFGVPIYIASFYRCNTLNTAVGGVPTSQHVLGEAVDLDAERYGSITNKDIYTYIKDNLEFDQLIWEFGTNEEPDWVHVSFTTSKPNRKEIIIDIK